jgi:hypothetical protein
MAATLRSTSHQMNHRLRVPTEQAKLVLTVGA